MSKSVGAAAVAAGGVACLVLVSGTAQAGDPLGISDSGSQFIEALVAMGIIAAIGVVVVMGLGMAFGAFQILGIAIPALIGGFMVGNAEDIGGTLFNADIGGGSVMQVSAALVPEGTAAEF